MLVRSLIALIGIVVLASTANASVDVKKFGAKGNGLVDDSKAIQKALDAASAKGGGSVELGVGKFRIDSPLTVPEGVTLAGVWEAPHHAQLDKGTVLEIYAGKNDENAPPAITLSPSSAIKGINFYYPEQRMPEPFAYPYTIHGAGMHCSVFDCTFVNSYKAIDFGTKWNELHYIRNCFGCPLKIGVHIDKCSDIGRIENVHFNPHYWMRSGAANLPTWEQLRDYLFKNLVAFEFGRTDWEYVHNTFCFGGKVGYRFFKDTDGTVNGNFLGIGADWCEVSVLVEDCQGPGLLITNGEFVVGEGGKAFVEVASTNSGVVQFSNSAFWGPCGKVAIIEGTGPVSFNQCNFQNHTEVVDKPYAIDVRSGDVTIQACEFKYGGPDIKLGKDVKTAVIMGNRFYDQKQIDNQSQGDVQEGLNVIRK